MSSGSEDRDEARNPTISFRASRELRKFLEAYAASESQTISAAACFILQDWLRTHGWASEEGQTAEGPATDAVDAMDKAIKKDRAGGKQRRVASIKETGEELSQEQWERFEAVDKKPPRKD